MPKFRLKRALQLLLAGILLGATAGTAFILHQGKRIASPDRRPLQDYHREYFANPAEHGIHIDRLTCLEDKAPCLIITPDASAGLGRRGKLIRLQIQSSPVAHGHVVGTVVLLHGRNGRKEDLLPVAERFCAIGLRCLIPDLPAHGESPVHATRFGLDEWEKNLSADVLNECAKHFEFDPRPAALWGISMGGSFATSAASAIRSHWSSLTIVSSFDRLDHVIEGQCRSAILAGFISDISQRNGGPKLSAVQPQRWATKAKLPVLVAHGTDDALIDEELGHRLYSSFPSEEKRWVEVEGGTHSNVLTTPKPLYSIMADWILVHLGGDRTTE